MTQTIWTDFTTTIEDLDDAMALVGAYPYMQNPRLSTVFAMFAFDNRQYGQTFAEQISERLGTMKTTEPDITCSWCDEEYDPSEVELIGTSSSAQYRYIDRGGHEPDDLIRGGYAVYLCSDCMDVKYYCDDCGTLCNLDSDVHTLSSDDTVCDSCYDYYNYCEDHGIDYRDDCYLCHDERSNLIHDYGYRPEPVFHIGDANFVFREPRHKSVTGFELEMEAEECNVRDGAELANSLFGHVGYLKYDGSLDDGFELVTHPMSREYVDSVFNFDGVRELAKMGMRSAQTSSCGLHVHINKGFFDGRETSLYRFMSLFYRNQTQWRALAGRQESSYAKWNQDEQDNMMNYTRGLRQRDRYARNGDRYVAVNLQPSNTIELRFFKGTLRPATLKARIEAIHAVAEYSVATRNKLNIKSSSDWDSFREFALANGYNAFSEYATTRGV